MHLIEEPADECIKQLGVECAFDDVAVKYAIF